MPRQDLLALSDEDLATLSTRGKVKEARKDLTANGITGQIEESSVGDLHVLWSDGRTSDLPSGATLRQGRCSCGAVDPCKHLVRLVLLYQQHASAGESPRANGPWDPGQISDESVNHHYRPSTLAKIRQLFNTGILVELVRGVKPVARFHLPVCRVQFLVPGDLRYARCDCGKPSLCEHIPLAVWAFRELPAEKRGGIVTAGETTHKVDINLLDTIASTLIELAIQGVSGAARTWNDRLARLAAQCEKAELIWPGEIVTELLLQLESYQTHDARFDPPRVNELVSELHLRVEAIRQNIAAVPQLLVRGTRSDRAMNLGFGEYWGLGTGIHLRRDRVELVAHVYDANSGGVLVIPRTIKEIADKESGEARSFATLGGYSALKGSTFHTLGVSILQLQGGKRSAEFELLPGRSHFGLLVQDHFSWEEIPPPVLVEEFAELEDRLSSFPPSAFRPRRLTEDFHVLRVAKVDQPHFDSASHTIQAILSDRTGRKALLSHPYTSRGSSGAEALLGQLTSSNAQLLFVSGSVRRTNTGLIIEPVCLVFQQGDRRMALQPWIERGGEASAPPIHGIAPVVAQDPVRDYLTQIDDHLGELLLLGVGRAEATLSRRWNELVHAGEAIGLARLVDAVAQMASALEQKLHTPRWDGNEAARHFLYLAALVRLARDV